MRRLGSALVALALFTAVAPALAAGAQAAPAWHTWVGKGTNVFRDATYDRGEFIYSNGVFQALGANSDTVHRTDYFACFGQAAPLYSPPNDLYRAMTYDFFGSHRSTHNGDYQLPTDRTRYPDFTADLAEVRLAATASDLFVRLTYTSFPRPDAQVATLTFATAGANPPSRAWPRNAGVKSPWTVAVTLWGTGGAIDTTGGSTPLAGASGAVRAGDHVVEARVPLAELPAGPWVMTGGSGLSDPAAMGTYWSVPAGQASATAPGAGFAVAPGSNVWDLLFARDSTWTFDERKQADDLASGDVGGDTQTVSLAALQQGRTIPAAARTGDISRFFTSRIGTADGITRTTGASDPIQPLPVPPTPCVTPHLQDFDMNYFYTGRLQPYYMHVPVSYATRKAPMPLIIYLHGFTGLPDEPFYNPIGLVDTADQHGYLFASALGRGDYFYRGAGDVDVQEVLADVEKHYDVDPNRVYLMGHSMGGYGTNNVGMHHPDLFAALAPAEGTDSIPLHDNLRNLPWFIMTADFDLDVMGQNANQLYSDLSASGYDAALIQYHLKIHEYSSIYDTLPRIFRLFDSRVRNPNPPVVSYTRDPTQDDPSIGLAYDHAYWVSGMAYADRTKLESVKVETFGLPHSDLDPAHAVTTDASVDEGGPSGRTTAVLKTTTPAYGSPVAQRNAFAVDALNTTALSVDPKRMGLRTDCALTVEVKSDHALTVDVGGATVRAPAGTSTETVGSGVCAANTAAGPGLPATTRGAQPSGANEGLVALAASAVLSGIVLSLRRRQRAVR